MNKQELIERYRAFITLHHLTAEQVIVGAGGALCLMGLRQETQDIDIDVGPRVFEMFLSQGLPTHYFGKTRVLVVEVAELIDAHLLNNRVTVVKTDGVCHYSAKAVLEFKQRLNRPKDQADIKALIRYLAK